MEPRRGAVRYLLAGAFRRMAWVEWGDPAAPVVLCVHGLTRNARDFDPLAQALAADFRVVCPDLPGRGASDWLADPQLYQPPTYVAALSHLLAAIGGPTAWVGTSLGGICGMAVAAAQGHPVTRMVLNDIGPFLPKGALQGIRERIGRVGDFADVAEAEQFLRVAHAPFGRLTDAQWAHMARHSVRMLPNGRVALHYDPAIATPIVAAEPEDVDLWEMWARIAIPTLVLRGATSDLLDEPTLARMVESGAKALTVPGCGHAPAMMDAPTIAAVRDFLRAG
ncbi:alpha/beta fold hydrolase [Limobrevibacterium gyesilva]|uniref:Alpha/beta hydrolase n=1 Tax=Limobrevibacterium gyesilva TaxID=2991712 RepID=A0AA41YI65_9PROT|nr:alpha/beta hydrolase [Limobrevibacterium gyesilva]MCW3473969.1 alpha/beta hydrolase [Limobrevibacterium gyesilva]